MSLFHNFGRNFATVAALLAAAAMSARAETKPETGSLATGPVVIQATPIDAFSRTDGSATRFGKLEFRGGLVLSVPGNKNFGGWSGLALDANGRDFISVSDAGAWMTGRIAYTGVHPSGIENARMGPMLSQDGQPLKRNRDRDAEAVAVLSGSVTNGTLLVAFEQNSRIARYDISSAGLSPALSFLDKPKLARAMRRNNGLEAMTILKGGPFKGATIAMSERFYNSARNHSGWIWTAAGPQEFHLTNIGDFDVTDLASLDDGTLFVLERRFRWLEGIKMRLRRVSPNELQPGKTAEGEILIEANLEQHIDNMEGLAVSRGPAAETIVTMISDNNFNRFLQRTLLLQFAVKDTKTAKTRP
jgi:hypothetical protein